MNDRLEGEVGDLRSAFFEAAAFLILLPFKFDLFCWLLNFSKYDLSNAV